MSALIEKYNYKVEYLRTLGETLKRIQKLCILFKKEIENLPEDSYENNDMGELISNFIILSASFKALITYTRRIKMIPFFLLGQRDIVADTAKFFGHDGWGKLINACKEMEKHFGIGED